MQLGKIFFLFIFSNLFVLAEEHGAPPAGGEHGGGAAVVNTDYSGKQSQAWSEVQTKLAAAKAKVDSQEALVKALTSEKEHHSAAPSNEKIEQLKKEHQKWLKLISEYNKLNTEYETKFPEKGIKEARKYKRIEAKSIERIESDMSFDGRINRLQSKILKQYPQTAKKIEAEKERKRKIEEAKKMKLGKSAQPDDHQKKKIKSGSDVTEQIILNK